MPGKLDFPTLPPSIGKTQKEFKMPQESYLHSSRGLVHQTNVTPVPIRARYSCAVVSYEGNVVASFSSYPKLFCAVAFVQIKTS